MAGARPSPIVFDPASEALQTSFGLPVARRSASGGMIHVAAIQMKPETTTRAAKMRKPFKLIARQPLFEGEVCHTRAIVW